MQEKPIISGEYVIQRFPGKGGWTYVALPGVKTSSDQPFGWRLVKGRIDAYSFEQYHLMPMGNGDLFLPIKGAVRKIIKKTVGDSVSIALFDDHSKPLIPEYLLESLSFEEKYLERFQKSSTSFQRSWIKKIESAKTDAGKSRRILDLMQTLEKE